MQLYASDSFPIQHISIYTHILVCMSVWTLICFPVWTLCHWHDDFSKWEHQSSALLTLCAWNSQVTGEFPAQRPATQNFDVFFDLCLNKRLSKQSIRWWFETLIMIWDAHYDVIVMTTNLSDIIAHSIDGHTNYYYSKDAFGDVI